MTTEDHRPNILISLLLLAVVIVVGAHLSGIPLLLTKGVTTVLLVFGYGYFALRIVNAMRIGSPGTRAFVGLLLGATILWATWAVRIPAFSMWEVAFAAEPSVVFNSVMERAGSMQVSRSFGSGTTADGPSWLMLGTYLIEAFAFVGVTVFCAVVCEPKEPEATTAETESVPNITEEAA